MRTATIRLLFLLLAVTIPAAESWYPSAPRETTLGNQLRVVFQHDPAASITVLQLLVRSGRSGDPVGKAGLAFLTARLCLEVPEETKLRRLLEMGCSFNLHVSADYLTISLRTLSAHFEPALAILAEGVADPLFSDLRIDAVKEMMGTLEKLEEDEPEAFMRTRQAAALFGPGGYGSSAYGSEATRKAIRRREVQEFHRRAFAAGNLTAVVISDLDEDAALAALTRHLGRLPAGPPAGAPAVTLSPPVPGAEVCDRQTAQALLARSARLPAMTPDSFIVATLLESWLGRGIGSQLWTLRERLLLAYDVEAELQPMREGGLLHAYLKTNRERAGEAGAALDNRLGEIIAAGITDSQLQAAKAYAVAEFFRLTEPRERRAGLLALLEGIGLGWRLAGEWPQRIEALSLEEVNRFIRQFLDPARWQKLGIGPLAVQGSGANPP